VIQLIISLFISLNLQASINKDAVKEELLKKYLTTYSDQKQLNHLTSYSSYLSWSKRFQKETSKHYSCRRTLRCCSAHWKCLALDNNYNYWWKSY
jgi:hypothetical protein